MLASILLLLGIASAEVLFSFNREMPTSVNVRNAVVYTPTGFVNITLLAKPACGAACIVGFSVEDSGTYVSMVIQNGARANISSSSGKLISVEVMWCTPGYIASNSRFLSIPYTFNRPATTVGKILEGTCPSRPSDNTLSLSGFVDVALGSSHACAVHSEGTVYCWGTNDMCQFGSLASSPEPYHYMVPVPWFSDFVGPIRARNSITCAMRQTGDLICWGSPVAVPTGTDCRSYQYGRMAFHSVSSFAISDSVVAAISGDNLLLSGVSSTIISPNIDTYEIPNYPVDDTPAWSAYPTIAIPVFDPTSAVYGFKVPYGATATSVFAGTGNTFAFGGANSTVLVLMSGNPQPAICSPSDQYGILASAMLMNNVTVCNTLSGQAATSGMLVPDTFLYVYEFPTPVTLQQMVLQPSPTSIYQQQFSEPLSAYSEFSLGVDHFCVSGPTAHACIANQEVQVSLTGLLPTPSQTFYSYDGSVSRVSAGGSATCIISGEQRQISCYGAVGTGVVQIYGDYGNFVNGVFQQSHPFALVGETQTTQQVYSVYSVSGQGGCSKNMSVYQQGVGLIKTVTAMPRPVYYQLNPTACLQVTSCVDRSWKKDFGPFPTCVSQVAAGDYHTCVLSCDGVAMCTGAITTCQYIMAGLGNYNTFNPIWLGSSTSAASAIYASGNVTCVVGVSNKTISCTGSFPTGGMMCSKSTAYEFSASGSDTIDNVMVSPVAVCVSVKSTDRRISIACIGDPASTKLGTPSITALQWRYCISAPQQKLVFTAPSNFSITTDASLSGIVIVSDSTIYYPLAKYAPFSVVGSRQGIPSSYTQLVSAYSGIAYITPKTLTAVPVADLQPATVVLPFGHNAQVAAGGESQCAVMAEGSFYCTGPFPNISIVGSYVTKIAKGIDHIVVLTEGNRVCCSGSNSRGQCGRLHTDYSTSDFVCISNITDTWPYFVPGIKNSTPIITPVPRDFMDPLYFNVLLGMAFSMLAIGSSASVLCAIILYNRYTK